MFAFLISVPGMRCHALTGSSTFEFSYNTMKLRPIDAYHHSSIVLCIGSRTASLTTFQLGSLSSVVPNTSARLVRNAPEYMMPPVTPDDMSARNDR